MYADNVGTYKQVLHSIEDILTDSTLSRRLKNIWSLSVLHAYNLDVVKILQHHHCIGLRSVQMKIVRLDKNNPLSINERNIDELLSYYNSLTDAIIQELHKGEKTLISMFLNDNDYFGKILRRIMSRTPVIYRCGAGKNKISICANGDIYPCDSFAGNDRFKMGNVFEPINENMMNKFYEYSIYTNNKCKDCWIRHICGGDCYYNSYLTNHKIEIPDDIICYLNMNLAVMAFRVLIEVEKDEQLSQYFNRILITRPSTY